MHGCPGHLVWDQSWILCGPSRDPQAPHAYYEDCLVPIPGWTSWQSGGVSDMDREVHPRLFQNLDKYKEYVSSDDLAWLSDNSPLSSGLVAPQDYLIKLSERVKHLERPDFWLGENDNDWHIPILLTIREHAYRNWRKRSAEKSTAREEKKIKSSTGSSQGHARSWSSKSWSSQTWSSHQSWSQW